jgi:hypothetical protein
MERINMSRVILGGIVAGIVADVLGTIVDGMILAPQWAEGMKALGRPDFSVNQIIGFNIIGLAYGIFACGSTQPSVPATARGPEPPCAPEWRYGSPESCCPTRGSWGRLVCSPPT